MRHAFGKIYLITNVSQISQLWKQYGNYSVGSLHSEKLLVYLSNTPAVGTPHKVHIVKIIQAQIL